MHWHQTFHADKQPVSALGVNSVWTGMQVTLNGKSYTKRNRTSAQVLVITSVQKDQKLQRGSALVYNL